MDNQEQQNNFQNPQQPTIQGPPPQNPQPEQPTQPQQPQQYQQPPMNNVDPGKGMGIASLILAIFGISIVSLPLGIIARNKSKSVGKTNIPALIGIVLSALNFLAVVLILVLTTSTFNNAQNGAKKSEISSTIAQSQAKLGEYYNVNQQYPENISELKTYLNETGNAYTAEKLTNFESIITYRALKADRTQPCSGQDLDCQEYEITADANYWNGDEDLVELSR